MTQVAATVIALGLAVAVALGNALPSSLSAANASSAVASFGQWQHDGQGYDGRRRSLTASPSPPRFLNMSDVRLLIPQYISKGANNYKMEVRRAAQ